MNKVLEAILKGIQMGLEILDDELDLSVFKGSLIASDYHVDRADQLRWRRENFVDLGLPSGTLWCKWNIGATCGDTHESWYGNYYAWGEIKPKKNYTLATYKHYNGSSDSLTKYNGNDRKTTLDPEDDAVVAFLGKDFRMPSKEDIEELNSLPNEWVKNYNGGLNGRIFTGNNGKLLFVPAAGFRHMSYLYNAGSSCSMWSSSLNFAGPSNAYYIKFDSDDIDPFDYCNRYNGLSVRSILKK